MSETKAPSQEKGGAETGGRDYSQTLFLPRTDFPMRAGLPAKEPEIIARWDDMDLYARQREAASGRDKYVLHDGPPYAVHLQQLDAMPQFPVVRVLAQVLYTCSI